MRPNSCAVVCTTYTDRYKQYVMGTRSWMLTSRGLKPREYKGKQKAIGLTGGLEEWWSIRNTTQRKCTSDVLNVRFTYFTKAVWDFVNNKLVGLPCYSSFITVLDFQNQILINKV